jgi:hypothetical protein
MLQNAKNQIGSSDYDWWTAKGGIRWIGDPKCNLFIYDMATSAGVDVPLVNGGVYPPTAGQWADPSFSIQGWEIVTDPMWGDIAAIGRESFNATGHVGFVSDVSNFTVSATTSYGVVHNSWGFRSGQPIPTFRRYIGQ